MADKVGEINVPRGPDLPDPSQMLGFDRDLNRQLTDYLSQLARKANSADITDGGVIVGDVDLTGDLIVTGDGSFTGSLTVADEAYDDAGWDGDLSVPTKNAIRDIWETLGTAAFEDTGTSGHTLGFLDGTNAWSGINTYDPELWVERISDTAATVPIVKFQKARVGPAAVQNGDGVGGFLWAPYDGDSYGSPNPAAILAHARETHSNTAHGTTISFETTPNGSTTRAERLRVGSGIFHPSATGTDQGNNTLNFTTIYRNANLVPGPASQAEGDILYRTSTDWARLAKGTAGQLLAQNSGLTAPEWVSPDYEYVGTVTASSSSQLLIDSSTTGALVAGYDYILVLDELQPSADAYITLQYGTGGTPTYQNTNYQTEVLSSNGNSRSAITTAVYFSHTSSPGGVTAGETITGIITILNVGANALHGVQGIVKNTLNAGEIRTSTITGFRNTAEVLTGLRLAMNTGNINSGTVRVYRRRTT